MRRTATTITVPGPRGKYANRKVDVDGIVFDSGVEAARYRELRILERIGAIRDLSCQPAYVLQVGFRDKWKRWHTAIKYTADFGYYDVERGCPVAEDVKSEKCRRDGSLVHPTDTEAFRIRARLFQRLYPAIYLHVEYRR